MKNLRLLLLLILIFIIPTGAAASDSWDVNVVQTDSSWMVSGTIAEASNANVTVEILNPRITEDDLASVSAGNFTDAFNNVFEVKADTKGKFATSQFEIGDVSGYFSVRISHSNNTSAPMLMKNAILNVTDSFESDALAAINGSVETACTFVANNYEIIIPVADDLTAASSDGRRNIILRAVNERSHLEGGSFESVEQFGAILSQSILLDLIKDSKNGSECIEEIEKYMDCCRFETECTPLFMIKTEFDDGQKVALGDKIIQVGFADSLSKTFEKYGEAALFAAIDIVSNHSEISDIIKTNEAFIGADLKNYNALSDKKPVNSKIMNNSFVNVEDLASFIETASSAALKEQSSFGTSNSGSGANKGAGGGGVSVNISSGTSVGQPSQEQENAEGSPNAEKTPSFADMAGYEWANDAVSNLCSIGIVNGVSENTFAPSANVKREEFVKMLILAFESYNPGFECNFRDVVPSQWHYPYIAFAVQSQLVTGIDDTTFGSGRSITREDMAVLVYRAVSKKLALPGSSVIEFNDGEYISDYALQAVSALSEANLINGKGNGNFDPKSFSTRAEAAQMIYNAYQAVKGVAE